jgi:hypothetical protein
MVGDLEFREDKLLLLERRLVSRYGNRSFIEGDLGVPSKERGVDSRVLDFASGSPVPERDIDLI